MPAKLTSEQATRVERMAPRVASIAITVGRGLSHVPRSDLESAGNEALVRAATRYDPETGVPFANYAYYRIRGAMLDTARKQAPGTRQARRALLKLEASQSLLEHETRRGTHNIEDAARRVAAARAIYERHAQMAKLANDTPVEPDSVTIDRDNPETQLLAKERRLRIENLTAQLPTEDRELLEAIYNRDISMRQYATQMGVSAATVSRRHARLLDKIGQLMGPQSEPRRPS